MKKHYLVYQITNLVNDKIYIGIHSTDDVDDGYMGSGRLMKLAIKTYGIRNFKKEILFDFDNPEEMILKESELVDRKFIARKDVYNIILGGVGWNVHDCALVKDGDGNCFLVHKTDERYLSGELIFLHCGKVTMRDADGNRHWVDVNDARIKSGLLVSCIKGTILVVNSEGVTFRVSVDDKRIKTGELIPFWLGKKHNENTKQKIGAANSIHQLGEKNSQYGTCWVMRDGISKKIKKEQIDLYIADGWESGRKMKYHHHNVLV